MSRAFRYASRLALVIVAISAFALPAAALDDECVVWRHDVLPPCLPDTIPIPAGLTVWRSVGDPLAGAYLVQGEVPDDIGAVVKFFGQRAKENGWRQTQYRKEPPNRLLRLGYARGDLRFEVTLAPNGLNRTRMTLESSRGDAAGIQSFE